MNLDSFTGPGSTPSRRRFWDKVTAAVNASQKVQGENVSVEEHEGMGTLINVSNSNRRPTPSGTTGACCNEGVCTQTTEGDCVGDFRGVGTPCDPNPCCTNCSPGLFFAPGCTDGDGNCRTGPENCDECTGEIVPCDSLWATLTEYCITCPGGDLEVCAISTVDPITCELNLECISHDCCDCGTTQMTSDQAFFCPELSPPP